MKRFTTILILTLITPILVFGQFPISGGEELSIIMSPENPKAGETVSLRVISSSSNLDNDLIFWRKNGTVVKKGIGEKFYSLTTVGELGGSTQISVEVEKGDGTFLEKKITVRPGNVSLIWEADSYTPILYKGKGLPAHQTKVRVIAIASLIDNSGAKIKDSNLLYEWYFNGNLNKEQSGFGKNVFEFRGAVVSRSKNISVVVSNSEKSLSARDIIVVDFIEPEILVYKENPLTGTKNNLSLKKGLVRGGETTFVIEPFYFSKDLYDGSSLDFKWSVDGKAFDALRGSRKVVFSGDIAGESSISVEVTNPLTLLQKARKSFSVVVEK